MTITGIEKYKNMEGYVAVGGDLVAALISELKR